MRVNVLGPLQVVVDGAPVEVRGKRLRWLLIRLAMEPGRVVAADRLVADLWPDEPPVDGVAALQSLVSRLRRTLGAASVSSHASGYRLEALTDVEEFTRTRDAALWRGAAFEEAPFAVDEAVRLALLRDDLAGLEALAAAHPLREDVQARLMLALHAAGRRSDALALFERVRSDLADSLGVDPGEALAAAHLTVLRERGPRGNLPTAVGSFVGRDDDLAALATLLRDNRLVTLTGFGGVGKTRLALTHAATCPQAWLVELDSSAEPLAALDAALGPNPLAMPVFARLGASLVVLDNCEHVVDAAAALCVRLLAEAPDARVLATSREPLGIPGEVVHPVAPLDLDHAVRLFTARVGAALDTGAVRRVCAALDGIPLALELAAARARSLSLPQLESRVDSRLRLLDRGARTGPARHRTLRAVIDWSWELLDDAERLLLARLAVFVGGATASAVHEVCRDGSGGPAVPGGEVRFGGEVGSGGLPPQLFDASQGSPSAHRGGIGHDSAVVGLAVSEAASGTVLPGTVLPETELPGSEVAGTELSGAQVPGAPAPHHSAEERRPALSPPEAEHRTSHPAPQPSTAPQPTRAGSRRGTPESGTPAFQRTQGVRQDQDLWDTEDLLGALVEKSLVVRTGERYRLLETVREYAAEQGEADPAKHAACYTALAERYEPLLRGPRQVEALRFFDVERGNLDAAQAWAVRHDAGIARRLMAARTWHWLVMTKRFEEIRRWAALTPDDPLSEVVVARGTPEALVAAERLWDGDVPMVLCALLLTNGRAWGEEELGARFERLARELELSSDEWALGFAALVRGLVAGEFSEGAALVAEAEYRRAVEVFRGVGDRWAVVFGLSCLVMVLVNRGAFAEAFEAVSEARLVAEELGDPDQVLVPMSVLVQTARIKTRLGDFAGAREDLDRSEGVLRDLDAGRVVQGRGEVAYFSGDYEKAVEHYRAALGVTAELPVSQFQASVHAGLGLALTRLGRLAEAGEEHARAFAAVEGNSDGPARAMVLEHYADWLLAQGDPRGAGEALDEAERLRGAASSNPAVVELRDRVRAEVGVDR
ncbi:Transcriptional regulatory protein, C terminal [Lentzea fradiae]|uniref:Transcriptional regulatory protein, C terminal n=1 Tax=Lentzea fradiae TaxID=200378 RepID=A0A1G7K128_9PSEU|nr:BTAD domain-containing putative transcriptional regulator [Lentzea fradiae]SDF30701.1 Transcriptional regulatory protein, C terminal [Lentzea fradiae]